MFVDMAPLCWMNATSMASLRVLELSVVSACLYVCAWVFVWPRCAYSLCSFLLLGIFCALSHTSPRQRSCIFLSAYLCPVTCPPVRLCSFTFCFLLGSDLVYSYLLHSGFEGALSSFEASNAHTALASRTPDAAAMLSTLALRKSMNHH